MSQPSKTSPAALLSEPPLRALVRLAAPTTAVMSIAALQQVLHTYFVSHLGGVAIAAISLVFPIALILTTVVGGGIGSGVSSAVARALGAGKPHEAESVAEHAFVLTMGMALVFTVCALAFERPLFSAMGGKDEVLETSLMVARIFFSGLVVSFFIGTCDSILRGSGNVRVPAMCSTLSLLSQMALTPLLMFTIGLGIRGAPAAAIAGQVIGAVPRLRFVFGSKAAVRSRLWPRHMHGATMATILRVGVPASLGTLINYLGMIALTAVMARYGTAELAGYGLGSRFDFVLMTICYGTGIAVLTLVGFATGAGRPHLASAFAKRAALGLASVIAVPTVLLLIWPKLWLGMFTDDPAIIDAGAHYFRVIGFTYPLMGVSMSLSFAFQGLGRALMPMLVGLLRMSVIVIGSIVLASKLGASITSVFLLVTCTTFVTASILVVAFIRSQPRVAAEADQRLESEPTRYTGAVS